MSILLAIVGLGLLIVLHEGGHFLVARLCGMRVERFSIGFGPQLLGFKRWGTTFQIAPIPLGGFVQITGLNPNEEFDKADPFVYPNRPTWMRLATILAGPAANYLTAIVLMLVVLLTFGASRNHKITETVPGKPAAAAGLMGGDVLVRANGRAVGEDSPIKEIIAASQGAPVVVEVLRDGKPLSFTVTPEQQKTAGAYLIGIHVGGTDPQPLPVAAALKEAVIFPFKATGKILTGLSDMIRGRVDAELSGPIGITKQIAKAADRGWADFLGMIILLSVYLGLFNLLPLPALDGGRALFLGIESVTRRRVNPRIEAAVHTVGFVLLLGVLVIVSFKDIFGKG
jgi:regulator of sigma E protease